LASRSSSGRWEGDWCRPASLSGSWKGSRYLSVPNARDLSAAGWHSGRWPPPPCWVVCGQTPRPTKCCLLLARRQRRHEIVQTRPDRRVANGKSGVPRTVDPAKEASHWPRGDGDTTELGRTAEDRLNRWRRLARALLLLTGCIGGLENRLSRCEGRCKQKTLAATRGCSLLMVRGESP
jgi:hypothetical protein